MKKTIASLATGAMFLLSAMPVLAVKPDWNLARAQSVEWNLSADVMPVPPYGTYDIDGSDTSSRLMVNQPNGDAEVVLAAIMKGLNPLTTYTVYLSKAYTPYLETGWNVTGSYTIDLTVGNTPYTEYLLLSQTGDEITGESLALNETQTQSVWEIDSGTVSGNEIEIFAHYKTSPSMQLVMNGIIASDGSMSGTWNDLVVLNPRSGKWSTTTGHATMTHTGNTGWTGLFTSTIQPFTFTTDEFGFGNWHINLRDENFIKSGTNTMSVWINSGGTLLISDNFTVEVEL